MRVSSLKRKTKSARHFSFAVDTYLEKENKYVMESNDPSEAKRRRVETSESDEQERAEALEYFSNFFHRKGIRHPAAKYANDKELFLEAVQKGGSALMHASSKLQDDEDVVLAAVQFCGSALRFASDRCAEIRKIALAAVKTMEML